MTKHTNKKIKKLIFPVGIFLLMFLAESVIGTAGIISYFYFSGKKNITAIESYTFNYSKTMAEAFARVAEFSYSTKQYSSLKTLFHEKIEENTIDEAFFVLSDGRLIVHSSTTAEKDLMGNIASDEIAYNLDMILLPLQTKNSDLILNNYNIVNKTVPFKRKERDLLTKYVYGDLNSTGWIFTKGVFYKDKPAGTVNFIISKDRIYTSIKESINQARYYTLLLIAVSMIISLVVSLFVLFRYRSIQKNALGSNPGYDEASIDEDVPELSADTKDADQADVIFLPDSNVIEPDMGSVNEYDSEQNIIEENQPASQQIKLREESESGEIVPLRRHDISSDDEYITVELLGEIEPEPEYKQQKEYTETIKEYIAPVINLDDYKKSINREIRDAIPLRKKR